MGINKSDTIKSSKSSSRPRIPTLDILRGLFLIVILVDHLPWGPSLFLQFITVKGWYFTSAAEGFFAISGILVGYIYGPKIIKNTGSVVRKIWKRAGLLYGLTVGFTVLFTIWAKVFPSVTDRMPLSDFSGAWDFIVKTLTLQNIYGWTDFLGYYAVFMLLAPVALWLIAKRLWPIVAIASLSIWLILGHSGILAPFTTWQVVFMFGIIIGYYLPQIESAYKSLNYKKELSKLIITTAIILYLASVVWIYLILFAHQIATADTMWIFHKLNNLYIGTEGWFNREKIGIARIAMGVVVFSALYILIRSRESTINRWTRGYLQLLGSNSLFVYSVQGFIIFSLTTIAPNYDSHSITINTSVGILSLVCICLVTYYRVRILDTINLAMRKARIIE